MAYFFENKFYTLLYIIPYYIIYGEICFFVKKTENFYFKLKIICFFFGWLENILYLCIEINK